MCGPICAIGIASGLGISRWFGIDDITLGLWIGALILSVSIQLNIFLTKKGKSFPFSFWVIFGGTWILSFLPISKTLIQDPSCNIFGFPRVICGSILGALILFLVDKVNNFIIDKHNKKVYFYYQRVIIPIIGLIIVSMIIESIC
ncbi:MAG: hypothetical protein KAS91_00185 [Candidatus Pacebacteria bacterium]|nr:hypothetical protein [Candidatus Paceibacterota bacterium]